MSKEGRYDKQRLTSYNAVQCSGIVYRISSDWIISLWTLVDSVISVVSPVLEL